MAFMWAFVLESCSPLKFSCIFWRCFHRERINRMKDTRDTKIGINENIIILNEINFETLEKQLVLKSQVVFLSY